MGEALRGLGLLVAVNRARALYGWEDRRTIAAEVALESFDCEHNYARRFYPRDLWVSLYGPIDEGEGHAG